MKKIYNFLLLVMSALLIAGCAIVPPEPKPTIELEKTEVTLSVDQFYEIEVEVKNITDYQLTFTSSDPSVASVDENGKVTALKEGACEVEVKIDGTDKKALLSVIVEPKQNPGAPLRILSTNSNILLPDSFQVIIEVEAGQDVVFTSSDEEIATVDEDGLISSVSAGTFTLTVALKNDPETFVTKEFTVKLDPLYIMSLLNVEKPLVQNVTTYGYNPDTRQQWVYGSVSQYFNSPLVIIEDFAPIDNNPYVGQKASEAMLMPLDRTGLVRPGILLEELKYITYHDTGNHTPGAGAYNNLAYMKGSDNRNNTARSWHYTVDENTIYYGVPDNEVTWQGDSYYAYAQSIGIETCVNYGSDLYVTWQRTAKLIASLFEKYGLGIEDIRQHYDWNKKDCPRALRNSGLYPEAMRLVEAEYMVLKYLSDYEISFNSLDPRYVDDRGKVIALPSAPKRVGYEVTITGPKGYQESEIFYSVLTPTTGGDVSNNNNDLVVANEFDQRVLLIPEEVTLTDAANILALAEEYKTLTPAVKALVITDYLLEQKFTDLQHLKKVDTPILIYEVFGNTEDNNYLKHGYIMLYNPSDKVVSLAGKFLMIGNNGFNFGANQEGIKWYQFKENDEIKPGGYYLVLGAEVENSAGLKYTALPDTVTNLVIPTNNGIVALTNDLIVPTSYLDEHIIDLLGYGDVQIYETTAIEGASQKAVKRNLLIDTNNNYLDFVLSVPEPINSFLVKMEDLTTQQAKVREVDLFIKLLAGKTLTADDVALFDQLVELYDTLNAAEIEMLACGDLYDEIYFEMEGLLHPELEKINEALKAMPKQIISDYTLPVVEGVSYRYKDGEDTSYYNIATGEYLKLSHQAVYVALIASCDETEKEFVINFGILEGNQQTVYITGIKAAPNNTYTGGGTYQEQLTATGFGGVVIIVNNKVYFIGNKSYIPLGKPSTGNTLDINDLRPLGNLLESGANLNNIGLVNGVPTGYNGTGALYQNNSGIALTFDPSFTYGRNNASYVGYSKVIFRVNSNGTYNVVQIIGDTGTNTSTNGTTITLQPGEFLWCPHAFDVGANYGTWLIAPGSSTTAPTLPLNQELTIKFYKNI